MGYTEVRGDLIKLAKEGEFDVITHGCNCFNTMGAGLAPQMAKAFMCDTYPQEEEMWRGDINKLGTIDYRKIILSFEMDSVGLTEIGSFARGSIKNSLTVINSYTQYLPGKNLDYEALTLCMRKINKKFKNEHIGLPKIGAGLGGGDWDRIKEIIKKELVDMQVTVVEYEKDSQ